MKFTQNLYNMRKVFTICACNTCIKMPNIRLYWQNQNESVMAAGNTNRFTIAMQWQ